MNLNDLLKKLIEEKYNELAKFKENGIFEKINEFEGNAVGQIGEKIYNHKTRKFYLNVGNEQKQIVAMNPQNQANFKLTLKLEDLEPIENFESKLRESFGNALQTPY